MLTMSNPSRRNWNNFFLGLAVALIPWLGIPLSFKKIALLVAGVLISIFSLARLDSARPARLDPVKSADNLINDTHDPATPAS